jgi:peptidyl-tRNA hydrolase
MQKRDQQMSRLYIIVPENLPPGLAAAQVAHVAFQFATRHPEITLDWLRESKYLIVLTVPDEVDLIHLSSRALEAGIAIES